MSRMIRWQWSSIRIGEIWITVRLGDDVSVFKATKLSQVLGEWLWGMVLNSSGRMLVMPQPKRIDTLRGLFTALRRSCDRVLACKYAGVAEQRSLYREMTEV